MLVDMYQKDVSMTTAFFCLEVYYKYMFLFRLLVYHSTAMSGDIALKLSSYVEISHVLSFDSLGIIIVLP